MLPALAHVDTWIFDLDDTLYPASADLLSQVRMRMTAYIAKLLDLEPLEAMKVQNRYFVDHGATLVGMMANHGVDPHDFLADVHDIEMDVLEENAPLAAAIAKLPGRKLVFTNGHAPYATRVLGRLGLGESFEAIHDIHAMDLKPKPAPSAYVGLCAAFDVAPETALFADDMARNLAPAKAIGMTTLWVDNGSEQAEERAGAAGRGHIDFTCSDLTGWLHDILEDQ